tara:strand:+ start:381 stop:1289 length:909 start_codon:yes stop_codon:yes gene_type:complete
MIYFYLIIFLFLSIFLKTPILAIFGGIIFSLLFKTDNEFIAKKFSTYILQTGIVLLGFSINFQSAINSSIQYMPAISIFVILTFTFVFLLGISLKIDKNYSLLVASGSSICGGTAMVSIAPIIKSKNEDLAAAMSIIFILNAIGILIFPYIGELLNLSQIQFGAWAATVIHDTSAVIGASMSYGYESLETASTLKLGRTLWLIPLIILVSITERNDKKYFPLPVFVILFIIAIIIGSYFNIPTEKEIIRNISQIILLTGLFSVGTQIALRNLKNINTKKIIYPIISWVLIIPFSFFIIFALA